MYICEHTTLKLFDFGKIIFAFGILQKYVLLTTITKEVVIKQNITMFYGPVRLSLVFIAFFIIGYGLNELSMRIYKKFKKDDIEEAQYNQD